MFKAIGSVLRAIAPTLLEALPIPGIGGMARAAITGIFGLDEGSTDKEIGMALKHATPEQLLALKKADQDFKIKMKELDIDLEEIHQADRDSARKMQIDTKSLIPGFLALVIFFGFFSLLACLIFVPIPKDAIPILEIMVGSLGAMVIQIIQFYYGSSRGSQDKTRILSDLDKK